MCVDVFRSRAQGQQVPGAGARALVWCRARTVALSRACRHYAPGTNRCFVSRVRGTKYCVVPNRSAPCVRAPVLASGHALLFFACRHEQFFAGQTVVVPGHKTSRVRPSARVVVVQAQEVLGAGGAHRCFVLSRAQAAGTRCQGGTSTGVFCVFVFPCRQQDRTRACFVFCVFLSRVHAPGGEY